MHKLRQRLSKLLFRLSDVLLSVAYRLNQKQDEIATATELQEDLSDLFPHTFTTFKDGMTSSVYTVRHDAAAKLVGWYVHEQGTPFVEDLMLAAKILLEDTNATNSDISLLINIWQAQASAKSDKDLEKARNDEYALLDRVAIIAPKN